MKTKADGFCRPWDLNPYQTVVAHHYADGEFKHVKTTQACAEQGDTLFEYLMRDLDDLGNEVAPDLYAEAAKRITYAIRELRYARAVIEAAGDAMVRAQEVASHQAVP